MPSLESRGVTRREADVLAALAERFTNAEVADHLCVSERTVESHVSSLLRKLDARNRLELADMAKELLAPPRTTPRLPPVLEMLADHTTYVGRQTERARLTDLWHHAAAGRILVGVIAGEAGMGKTRLAAELAAEVHAAGAHVMLGACFEQLPIPYAPFAQAVADDAAGLTDGELRRRIGTGDAWARLVGEVAARVDLPAAAEVFDAGAARAEVFGALHGYLSRAAETAPLLVVIEDVQWATTTTLDALRYLARSSGRAPLLVLITTRDVPPDLGDALSLFLADLARLATVERVDLLGLPESDVAALLEGQPDADAAWVRVETGGNPFLIREIADGLSTSGRSLESLLARRYALLDSEALLALEVASVLGAEFDVRVLAVVAERPLLDVYDSLEQARAAGLVRPAVDRSDRFTFVHALFRSARYEAIPAGRRLRIHERVVTALEGRPIDDRAIVELAHHACIAAPAGDARRALGYAVAAARLAEQSLALAEAASHYRSALACAELLDPPDPGLSLELGTRLGEVLQGAGAPDYREVLAAAADTARLLGDATALAEVGWALVKYGGPRDPGSPDQRLLAQITADALTTLGPEPTATRARTLAAASEDLCLTEPARGAALAEEALAIARQLDDPVTLGHVLLSYRVAARTPGNAAARHATADELIAIGDRIHQPTFTMLGLVARAWSLREEGDLRGAYEALDAGVAVRSEWLLPPVYAAAVLCFRAAGQSLHGSLADAERTAESVWELRTDGFDPTNWYGPATLLIRHSQGRLSELVPMIEAACLQPGIGDIYRAALAVGYAQAGRCREAGVIVRELTDEGLAGVAFNFTWLASVVALAEAAELIGDGGAAGRIAHALAPYEGWLADLPQAVIGPVDLALAQAALTAGDAAAAGRHAERAAEASRRRGTPIFLGRELVRLAAARRMSGAAEVEIRPLVDEALALAATTGADLIGQEARRYDLAP